MIFTVVQLFSSSSRAVGDLLLCLVSSLSEPIFVLACAFRDHAAAARRLRPRPARMDSAAWSLHPCSSAGSDGSCSSCQAWCRAGSFGEGRYKRLSLNRLCKDTAEALSLRPQLVFWCYGCNDISISKRGLPQPPGSEGRVFWLLLEKLLSGHLCQFFPLLPPWTLKSWWRCLCHVKRGLLLLQGSWLFIGLNVGWQIWSCFW